MTEQDIKGTPFSFGDALAIGLTKVGSESILKMTPVGDASWISGIIKLGLGYGAGTVIPANFKPMGISVRETVATALVVDGAEDIAYTAFKMLGLFGNSTQSQSSSNNVQGIDDTPMVAFGETSA